MNCEFRHPETPRNASTGKLLHINGLRLPKNRWAVSGTVVVRDVEAEGSVAEETGAQSKVYLVIMA